MRNAMNTRHTLLLIALLFTTVAFGQDFTMTNGTVNTCTGLFHDDGGPGGAAYSATSYTFTICPDNPGDVIQVDFFAFSLWQSPNPNNSDRLFIFDGPNTGSPSLGSYAGTQLQGLQVTGTINNPSGCLTFLFQVNPNTSGDFPGWEAGITCTTPCATPTAASEIIDPVPDGPEQTVGTCIGEPVTFADNGSFAEPGFNIETYLWNFDDGSLDSTSGTQVTHAFDEPGEYIVTLTVFDDNGCASLNLEPLQVLVSTVPVFNTTFDTEICLGETATLDGTAIQSQTWTSLPPQVVSGETFLADGAGFAYSTSLTFDFFEPGATLQSCDDLLGFFVNMEHSYLGDLAILLECPDGTTVNILEWPNNGGGTYLGEAVDDFLDLPGQNVPGVGYTYTWDPDATNGNVDDQPANNIDFVTETGENDNNDIVPEGTYQADGNLCDLVGCPMNGSWTMTITDNIGIDNGYIFFWGLDFDPSYYPDVTTFTPVIGLGPDSTFWTGPNITDVSADGNVIDFTPDETGSFDFTFSATNNFGCVQDTTVSVNVVPGPEADAGEDIVICTDSLQLDGSVAGVPPPPPNCDYTLEMFDSFGDGWNGFSVTILEDGVPIGTYQVDFGSEQTATIPVTHGATIEINTTSGTFDSEVSYELYNAAGGLVFSDDPPVAIGNSIWSGTVDCQPETPDYVFEWAPSDGLSNSNVANPMVLVDQTTEYVLTVYDPLHPLCATTDTVVVEFIPNLNPGEDNTIQVCYFDAPILLDGNLGGNPTPDGTWTDEDGDVVPDPETFDPADFPDGGTAVYTYTVGQADCEFSAELTIEVQTSAENPDCCITNAVVGESFAVCELTAQLSAEEPLGTGTWTSAPAGAIFANPNDPNTSVTVPSGGLYTFTFTDVNGVNCEDSDAMTVNFSPAYSFTLLSQEDPTCTGACNGTIAFDVTGGIAPITYLWSGGNSDPNTPGEGTGFCGESYQLTVVDAIGCSDSITFAFDNPPPPPVSAEATAAICHGECTGAIDINAPDGVLFTFDGGQTYQPESAIDSVCPGSYLVGLIDVFGCENSTVVEVEDPAPVIANFDYTPRPVTILNALVQFEDLSTPAPMDSLSWTIGLETLFAESGAPDPQFEFPTDSAGAYQVMLVAMNEFGCVDTTVQTIIVEEEFLLYIPNSFSPNGDGINEVWRPKGNNVHPDKYHLEIFDRYGHLVFETREFEQGWNGDINGGDFYGQNEVYIYRIEAASATTLEEKEYRGRVTLIR